MSVGLGFLFCGNSALSVSSAANPVFLVSSPSLFLLRPLCYLCGKAFVLLFSAVLGELSVSALSFSSSSLSS